MSVDTLLDDYLEEEREAEPTQRFVKSYSSPTIEMQAEATQMCLDILTNVPEPMEPTAKLLWRKSMEELISLKAEISLNDTEWKAAPRPPSRSSQQNIKSAGFSHAELKDIKHE